MVNSAEFAKRLQKVLDYYGVSATVFSEKIDFNRSTISHLLSGRNKPSLEFVMKVLKQFPEVELYWLLNGTGHFPSTSSAPEILKQESLPQTKTAKVDSNAGIKKETPLPSIPSSIAKSIESTSDIERIVIFYKDGSFKAYQ